MTDLSPDERKLLPLATITVLRGNAFRRDQPLVIWPFPDCHECGQPVEQIISHEKHFPDFSIQFACKPCDHKTELSREAVHRLSKAAVQAANHLETGGFLSAPDWLRGGVCCGCQGAGGPVAYRNHQDQAFCEHCAECDCRTVPCTKPVDDQLTADEARAEVDRLATELYRAQDALAFVGELCDIADRENRAITTADVRTWLEGVKCGRQLLAEEQGTRAATEPTDLREQYAALFRCPPGGQRLGDEPPGTIADAVFAVRDHELEQLRSDLEWTRQQLLDAQQEATKTVTRAEQAEAAIEAALTALHDLPYEHAKPILAALDRTEQP